EEFDVLEPRIHRGPNGQPVPLLQIADHLVNGAGFAARLAAAHGGRSLIGELVGSILTRPREYPLVDFLRADAEVDHPRECDQACYRCLQRYSNQAYHGLLDWRLGLAFLQLLHDPAWRCGLDGKFDGPALADWIQLARRYAEEMERFSEVDVRDV